MGPAEGGVAVKSGGIETTLHGPVKGQTGVIGQAENPQGTDLSPTLGSGQSIRLRFSSSALPSTVMSDSAIAPAAISGLSSPSAASGIASTLYTNAKNRFWRIVRIVARDSRIAAATPRSEPDTSTTSPVSLAMS